MEPRKTGGIQPLRKKDSVGRQLRLNLKLRLERAPFRLD
jgi:hypothetical protein